MNNLSNDKDNKELENKKKIWIGRLAIFFVFFHFLFILINTLPDNFTSSQTKAITNKYVSPIFSQKWSMFAPCPLWEDHIKFQFIKDNHQTEWFEPSTSYKTTHDYFKFLHYGDLLLGESNMLYWIRTDLHQIGVTEQREISIKEEEAFKKTTGYSLLKKYLKAHLIKRGLDDSYHANIILTFKNVKLNETFVYKMEI